MRVLVAEDDVVLGDALSHGLRLEAFAVDLVRDGGAALERLAVYDYDVVVLDRDLPVVHGDEVCRQVAGRGAGRGAGPRVLMLTAARGLPHTVAGFQAGADDYLAKPFEFDELVVRLRALGRRGPAVPPVLEFADLRVDPFRREVVRGGRYLRLSRKEFAVLEVLLQAQGGVVSAEVLLEKAWDEHVDPFTHVVRVTVSTLRRRLGSPWLIGTVRGVGYRMEAS